jgi:hypothetical protein
MPGFKARRQLASHECEYRDAEARVRVELRQIQAMHGNNTMVSAALVLDLLNPRGMWRFIGQDTGPMAAVQDEDVDPLTGCKSVKARPQTGLDRVQQAVQDARGGPAPVPPQGYA